MKDKLNKIKQHVYDRRARYTALATAVAIYAGVQVAKSLPVLEIEATVNTDASES